MKKYLMASLMVLLASCHAQTAASVGQGPPQPAGCTAASTATYTDGLNQDFYACGDKGWFRVGTAASPAQQPTLVHRGVYNDLAVVNEGITQPLGWTSTAGNLLVVYAASAPGSTAVGATANGEAMNPLVAFTTGRIPNNVWFLPNAPATSSISTAWSESDGAAAPTLIVAEFSGVSPTAKATGAPLTQDSGYVNALAPPALSYAAPNGSLVLSGTSFSAAAGGWTATPGWTLIASTTASAAGANAMMAYVIPGVPLPPLPMTIAAPASASYGYYDTWVVAIQ